jgi:alcohol dehydrogenase YqhD (iron-dependent ADH family)
MANPTDYEARANLMWASTWALNNFVRGGKLHAWTCHPIEHELSAFYDITHGLGLAIVTPRYLEYALNESNAKRYRQIAKEVFGIDGDDDIKIAKEFIYKLSEFFFKTCGLSSTLSEIGITDKYFKQMAEKAERGGTKNGFIALDKKGIEEILYKCL